VTARLVCALLGIGLGWVACYVLCAWRYGNKLHRLFGYIFELERVILSDDRLAARLERAAASGGGVER
jgi:hypothetical protein